MDIVPIDPRDATAEVNKPTYRVEIISRDRNAIATWRLTNAQDANEVFKWAEAEKEDGSVVVHVESYDHLNQGVTLLRILGVSYGEGCIEGEYPSGAKPPSKSSAELSGSD